MHKEITEKRLLIDGSRLITESLTRAGADVFIGYPITPANLLYLYSHQRFPSFFAAPDEITTLQWMCGFAAAGKIPVTATSFPGFALMVESVNMAYMMELPMVIVLVQRLGPATGTATCGAQGDISLLNGSISGGFSLPTLSVSNLTDCWDIPAQAVKMAVNLRTPVVLLTSKEEVMTQASFDISKLSDIEKITPNYYESDETYIPYKVKENLVPPFLPVSTSRHQVRITASTHDQKGILQNTSKEAIDNTRRLELKLEKNLNDYLFFDYDRQEEANTLLVSYGISSSASLEAAKILRERGENISVMVLKTLFPIPHKYYEIIENYQRVVIAEENLTGQYRKILFGHNHSKHITGVNSFAKMITPDEIIEEVTK